jgi:uncharacterized repeat protein (TIGR04052 family)
MKRSWFPPALLGLLIVSSLAATARAERKAVEVRFAARVGDTPVGCSASYPDIGKSRASIFLQDFRVYVSAVRLITAQGKEVPLALTPDQIWQDQAVGLLDFEDGTGNCNGNSAMNDRLRGTVPEGSYVGIAFEIGVPFKLNHQDPTLAAAPLNFSALTWPWAGGYKFTSIDFDTKAPGEREMVMHEGMQGHGGVSASGFSIHLGSSGCVSSGPRVPPRSACANPNRPSYRFKRFDPASEVLVLDLAKLLAATDVTVNAPETPSGCMASPKDNDCIDIMNRFGLRYRGKASTGQKFIRVEKAP